VVDVRDVYLCVCTTYNLSHLISKCLIYWNTDRKLSSLTIDSGSTNNVFIDRVLDKITPYCFVLNEELFHMRCCPIYQT